MKKFLTVLAATMFAAVFAFAANNVTVTPYTFTSAMTTTFLNTAPTSNVLTAASAPSSGLVTYTGTFATTPLAGQQVTISGFDTAGNNGTFPVTGGSSTTVVAYNPGGASDTHAGAAVVNVNVPAVGPILISKFVWVSPANVGDSVVVTDGTGQQTLFFHVATASDVSAGYFSAQYDKPTADFKVTLISSGTLDVYTAPFINGGTVTTNGTAVAAGACQAQPAVTVAGLTAGSAVYASLPNAPVATWQTGIDYNHITVLANTAVLYLCNPSAGSITPAAQVVNLRVAN